MGDPARETCCVKQGLNLSGTKSYGKLRLLPESPIGRLLEALDEKRLPIQAEMKKKHACQLCKEWTLLRDEAGKPIWPENGTFEYKVLKALRPKLKPSQVPYWYFWAELLDPESPQSINGKGS